MKSRNLQFAIDKNWADRLRRTQPDLSSKRLCAEDHPVEEQLIAAVEAADVDKAKLLLESGADVHYYDQLALRTACDEGYLDMVKLLLAYGADLHFGEDFALYTAVVHNHHVLVQYLINAGSDIQNLRKGFWSIITKCNPKLFQYLIYSGLEIDDMDIICAVRCDKLDIFKMLYHRLPNVNLSHLWKYTYTELAFSIMDYLLDLSEDLNLESKLLIGKVLIYGQLDLVKKILNRMPDHSKFLVNGSIKLVLLSRNIELTKFLLENGLNPNENSDLDEFIQFRYFELALKKINDKTPLEIAFDGQNSLELTKLLLSYGAVPTSQTLNKAALTGHKEIFQLIYQSDSWSKNDISDALYTAIINGTPNEFFYHIHLLTDDLDNEYLERIIHYCISESDVDILDYFVNSYGVERIMQLIDYSECSDNVKSYFDKNGKSNEKY